MFERFSLYTNIAKMVGMVCQPCRSIGGHSIEAYSRWMMGEGLNYQERKRERVPLPVCGMELMAGSLMDHWRTQHERGREPEWVEAPYTAI